MDISQSQGEHRLGAFYSHRFVDVDTFKGQQVEVRPTGWKDYFRYFLQRHQRRRAPFKLIALFM